MGVELSLYAGLSLLKNSHSNKLMASKGSLNIRGSSNDASFARKNSPSVKLHRVYRLWKQVLKCDFYYLFDYGIVCDKQEVLVK